MRALLPVLTMPIAVLTVAACTRDRPSTPGQATVVTVIDGDTVDVTIGGRRERVRLIGVDTPETKIPDQAPECFGPEASAATTAWLPPGTEVVLTRDVEARDRYGRLLAYVRRADGFDVNLELARQGFADELSIAPNQARADEIAVAVAQARAAGIGLWGACPSG